MRDRVVAVVGGGDSAAQEALTLAEAARRVIILHRGDALAAQAAYRDRVLRMQGSNCAAHHGRGDSRRRQRRRPARPRPRERRRRRSWTSAGVFVYIGLAPNTAFLGGGVARDAAGRIVTDRVDALRTAGALCRGCGARGLGRPRGDFGGRGGGGRDRDRSLPERRDFGWKRRMAESDHGSRSARLPAQGDGQAPRAAAREPWTASSSISSIACSTIPKPSWTRCSAGSRRICPPSTRASSSRARAGSMMLTCGRRSRAEGNAAILGVGL